MEFIKLPSELKENNPWIRIFGPHGSYVPSKKDWKDSTKWYYAADDNIPQNQFLRGMGEKENGIYYNLDPQPWIGKWNVNDYESLPKIVVLSLNPGISNGDLNFKEGIHHNEMDDQLGKHYYKLMKEIYSGKKDTSDVLFNDDYIYYNTDYWIKRMWKLVCKVCHITSEQYINIGTFNKLGKEDRNKIKNTFNKILFIDLFPYHSHNAKALNIEVKDNDFTPQFESMKFTRELVKWLIKNEVTFIYTRSQWLWEMYVEELKTYGKCFGLTNPQCSYFTEDNCCTTKRKYISQNPRISVFEKLGTILKK